MLTKSNVSEDEWVTISSVLVSVIEEPLAAYQFNNNILPKKIQITSSDGSIKIIAIEWSPITKSEIVDKILVTMPDVTSFKISEKFSSENKQDLLTIDQIVQIPHEEFVHFLTMAEDKVEKVREVINATFSNNVTLEKIFFDMHTLKAISQRYVRRDLIDANREAE